MGHMPNNTWELDHIGHVVHDLEEACEQYTGTFGFSLELREHLPEHRIDAAFLRCGGNLIELIAPSPGNTSLTNFLQKRGPGLHHICYRVPSVAAELERLATEGLELIDKIPRIGSRDLEVAFIHPKSCLGVLTELCSEPA